MKGFWA